MRMQLGGYNATGSRNLDTHDLEPLSGRRLFLTAWVFIADDIPASGNSTHAPVIPGKEGIGRGQFRSIGSSSLDLRAFVACRMPERGRTGIENRQHPIHRAAAPVLASNGLGKPPPPAGIFGYRRASSCETRAKR